MSRLPGRCSTPRGRRPAGRRYARAGGALALALLVSGCAYYNTFYSARKNFDQAEKLYRGGDQRASAQQMALYDQALKSATKLVVNYPHSKWVDDAVLLMGRSLLGKGEYDKALQKFAELSANFPQSPLRDQGLFYTAECYRQERKWESAAGALDSLQMLYPKSKLMDQAALERGQMLAAQRLYRDAIAYLLPLVQRGAGDQRFQLTLRLALADAFYGLAAYDSARVQYTWVGKNSDSDDLLRQVTLREGDCYEGLRDYPAAVQVYRLYEDGAQRIDYRDQARIRRAYALALGGHVPDGMALLGQMVTDKGISVTSASDALFRMGYIQEVLLDDFKAARDTYAKVLQSYASTPAAQQADQRLKSLQKIEELRAATSADTTGRKQAAAAAFMVAEHYLYDSGRPERAILEFGHVESLYTDTEYAPRAAFAVAWAFTHQLDRQASADSVWRDLLLRWPDAPLARAASACLRGKTDSLRVAGALEPTLLSAPLTPGAAAYTPPQIDLRSLRTKESAPAAPGAGKTGIGAVRDSSGIAGAARDSTRRVAAAGDSVKFTTAPRDTGRVAPRDTSRVAPLDTSAVAPRDTSAVAPRDTTKVARPDTTRTPAH